MQAEREGFVRLFRESPPSASRSDAEPAADRAPHERPGPGSVTWHLHGERLAVLGWTRAVLLQIAHPRVAAGVANHSTFRRTLLSPYSRLMATVCAMRTLTFGSDEAARQVAARINAIHDRVHGPVEAPDARPAEPTTYSAHDPELLAWVHVTLIDSTLRAYERLVGPIAAAERDRYCDEAGAVAGWFGVPASRLPRSAARLDEAMSEMLASGALRATPAAQTLVHDVLHPPLAWLGGPLTGFVRRLTIGELPAQIRALYGFTWSSRDQRALERASSLVRRWRSYTPDRLARWPESRVTTESSQNV